jgi:hypothetical protein
LIRIISRNNPLWGAPRIHGELLKLGIDIAQSTVAKYMSQRRGPRSPGLQLQLIVSLIISNSIPRVFAFRPQDRRRDGRAVSRRAARVAPFPLGGSEAKNEGQCCTAVPSGCARRRARHDRNPNPSRLRAGNHGNRPVTVVAERPQHHRPARIYFQSHILGEDEGGGSWSWRGNVPGYGLIASENAAIAFPAGLSGTNYFFGGSSRGSKTRSCRR